MRLLYEPSFYDNVRSMTIKVESLGTSALDVESEQDILDDYMPMVEFKDMDFKGYFNVDSSKNAIQVYPKEKYTLTMNLTIPTNYVDNSDGTISVTVGTKTITTNAMISEIDKINNAVLDDIKSNDKVLALFNADDITLSNGSISATKDSYIKTNTEAIAEVNNIYGTILSQSISTEGEGDLVTLSIVNKKIKVDKNFEAKFTIATKDIRNSELGKFLTTKDLVAESKCILFKNVVTNYVMKVIKDIKDKENDFEKLDPNVSEEF